MITFRFFLPLQKDVRSDEKLLNKWVLTKTIQLQICSLMTKKLKKQTEYINFLFFVQAQLWHKKTSDTGTKKTLDFVNLKVTLSTTTTNGFYLKQTNFISKQRDMHSTLLHLTFISVNLISFAWLRSSFFQHPKFFNVFSSLHPKDFKR